MRGSTNCLSTPMATDNESELLPRRADERRGIVGVCLIIGCRIAVAIALGLLLSVVPVFPFVFPFLGVPLLIILLVRVHLSGWRRDAMAVLTVVIVMTVCALLPVKQLDVEVGPIAYENLPLSELCQRLGSDYGVICHVSLSDPSGTTQRLSFRTDRPLSRRRILEKLSADTSRCLDIGYCGTGATILYGGSPSFTYLREKTSQ
jgi:hypothetical protein